ncbi:MAG: AtpZ/AtpI family protein [Parcubacteria group bacterium]|jgi:F0F1-type ATP synthase assembly protein I
MFKEDLKRNNKEMKNGKTDKLSVFSLAFELGYIVAIPIVLLALGGRMLDKKLDSSPWFLLSGIIISIIVSTYWIYKKTSAIIDNK